VTTTPSAEPAAHTLPASTARHEDLVWGAFTPDGPWALPEQWWALDEAPERRTAARRTAQQWQTQRPPIGRALRIAAEAVRVLVPWALTARRRADSRTVLCTRIAAAMGRLGPTYVKLAQIISAGDGVFPTELVAACATLRDSAPALPPGVARKVVAASLGAPGAELLAGFDDEPIAAASIAQVHRATLADGTAVVVKVRRPGIERTIAADLRALSWAAPRLVGRIPHAALANPPALVELFAETIVEELDFVVEAANTVDAARALAAWGDGSVVVARPHPTLLSDAVLVAEHITGAHPTRPDELTALGADGPAVLRALMSSLLRGALLAGVFHGDLHPGNLLVRPDGLVVLIDFGITGRFTDDERAAFTQLVAGALSGDWRTQVRSLVRLGALPADADVDELGEILGLDGPVVDPAALDADDLARELQRISAALLSSGARLPRQLMLWAKDIVFLDASFGVLAPDHDLVTVVAAVVTDLVTTHGAALAAVAGGQVAWSEEGIRRALAIPDDAGAMTWAQMRDRRELITRRAAGRFLQ
jgi:ubiquinone biosynthesis protein